VLRQQPIGAGPTARMGLSKGLGRREFPPREGPLGDFGGEGEGDEPPFQRVGELDGEEMSAAINGATPP
jgi:hypothetical protein